MAQSGADTREARRSRGYDHFGSLPQAERIQVDAVLERPRLGSLQIVVLVICALAAFVDGADRQGIGLVTVNLMADLHISASSMGMVFSLDNLGAVIGAVICGQLSDRYGRKPVMVVTLAIMAVATLFTAHSGSLAGLATARFVAGLGLGGAVPAFLTLASEYVSKRHRGTIAAVIFAGYPVGAACGGLWTNYLLRHFEWPSVFYVGAALPVLVMLATLLFLPESMQLLVRTGAKQEARQARAASTARRIAPELRGQAFTLVDTLEASGSKPGSLRALFANGLTSRTLVLWGIYLFLFATVKVVVIWVPSILTNGGIAQASVALVLTAWNMGSVTGQLTAFKLLDRFGPRLLLTWSLVLVTAALGLVGAYSSSFPIVLTTIVFAGYGVGVSTSGVIAITATLYPTEQRGTGMGAGMSASRFGQVLSPLLIGWLIQMAFGATAILYVIAAMPLAAAVLVVAFTALRARAPVAVRV